MDRRAISETFTPTPRDFSFVAAIEIRVFLISAAQRVGVFQFQEMSWYHESQFAITWRNDELYTYWATNFLYWMPTPSFNPWRHPSVPAPHMTNAPRSMINPNISFPTSALFGPTPFRSWKMLQSTSLKHIICCNFHEYFSGVHITLVYTCKVSLY